MITPEKDKIYIVKHSSGFVKARFLYLREHDGYTSRFGTFRTNATKHYIFLNLQSGREIEIKSRVKIRREFVETANV